MATKEDFRNFVERQQENVAEAKVDRTERLSIWLKCIESLYQMVRDYLLEYTEEGAVRLEFEELDINEERIGPYKTRRMIIEIGSKVLTLTPIGTMIIGAHGRVDLDGSAGSVRLVLVDPSVSAAAIRNRESGQGLRAKESGKDGALVWKISSAPPQIQLSDLTRDSFYDAVLEVTNG